MKPGQRVMTPDGEGGLVRPEDRRLGPGWFVLLGHDVIWYRTDEIHRIGALR